MRTSLSQRSKFIFNISIKLRRFKRHIEWIFDHSLCDKNTSNDVFEHVVFSHSSVLIRRLEGVDLILQHNKVKNLQIVSDYIHKIIIKPGEKFSLYQIVGKPTVRRGFVNGLEFSRGKMKGEIGGGLCQVANILHWMLLHTDLTIIERHHHSVDIFPDSERKVPFGTGATLFYNFKDFVFRNNTEKEYQILLYLYDEFLQGEILCNDVGHEHYRVFEKAHAFSKIGDDYYRENEIWREDMKNGVEELLFSNHYKTLYTPSEEVFSD